MSLLTEVTRPFRLQTKVPGCELHVRSFTGEEAVSRLFQFRVVVHADVHVPAAALLGQPATFVIAACASVEREQFHILPARFPGRPVPFVPEPHGVLERRFLAVIASVDELGLDEHDHALYALELVPRLWAMTRTVRARIFTELTPLDIISKVFQGRGISVRAITTTTPLRRPYCVQYFESDFDFVVRLLEEEGYIYEYQNQGETPVFTIRDLPSSFPRLGPLAFHDVTGAPEERIVSWKKKRILTATTVHTRDHLFEANAPLLTAAFSLPEPSRPIPGWEPLAANWFASIDRYPGQWAHLFEEVAPDGTTRVLTDDDGEESEFTGYVEAGIPRARHDLYQTAGWTSGSEGESNCPRLMPGSVFELVKHSTSSGEHFVVSVRHKGSQALDHSSREARGFAYENQFNCVPYEATTQWLPPRSTRKPVIHGCQTAKVMGPETTDTNSEDKNAEEIWTDKYGRVQVQFWWQSGERPSASCWVRVATPWAGSNWGIQHIPRTGQEVVVTFLDGDPDKPLIVGSVYNKVHMPPFDLSTCKTQSGIRTHSMEAGDWRESNEIRFEDARGKEEIYFHAQKDRTAVVKNESCEVVGSDRYDVVGNDFHAITCGDKREGIGGKSDLTVAGDSMNHFLGKLGVKAKEIHFKADKIVIEAKDISLRTENENQHFICLNGDGITIDSKGKEIWLNCGGKDKPDKGAYTDPAQPELPFKSVDPDDPDFGKLTE